MNSKLSNLRKEFVILMVPIVIIMMMWVYFFGKKELGPIRLGINIWPGYEYLFLAESMGYYKELGVDMQIVETASLDDLRRAYERGTVDVMATSLIEVVQAAANSGNIPKIFMITDYSNGADVIIAREGIESIKDLKDKRVGLEMASLGQFMVARALQKHNLSLDDIVMVPMAQEEMHQAILSVEVDAVMTYPPVSVKLLRDNTNKIIFDSSEIPGEIIDVVSATSQVVKERPGDLLKIIKAWEKALDFAAQSPAEAHKFAADRQNITPHEFKKSLEGIRLLNIDRQKSLFDEKVELENGIRLIKEIILTPGQYQELPSSEAFIFSKAIKLAD
ncbi:MAG: ABC transporter substrate-binding protein [Verrucomicrobiota bacterium]